MVSTRSSGDRRRHRRRPGSVRFTTGLVMAAIAVYLTLTVAYPVTLGVMIGLLLLYVVTAYLVIAGLVRMRVGDDERDPVGVGITPGTRSLRCAVLGHKEVFSPRDGMQSSGFRCRRCGAHGLGHLDVGRGWRCELPLADHVYDVVGKTDDSAQYWRCRRCGKRRFTPPTSAGESLDATRSELLWVKRYDD